MSENKKPILTANDLVSIMLKNVHLMEKDRNFKLYVQIGPNYDCLMNTDDYRFFYGNSHSSNIEYLKECVYRDIDSTSFDNSDDLRYVLRKLKGLSEKEKIYSINYFTSMWDIMFDFDNSVPTMAIDHDFYEKIDDEYHFRTEFTTLTDPIVGEVERDYRVV